MSYVFTRSHIVCTQVRFNSRSDRLYVICVRRTTKRKTHAGLLYSASTGNTALNGLLLKIPRKYDPYNVHFVPGASSSDVAIVAMNAV